jgi:hypothetical protein
MRKSTLLVLLTIAAYGVGAGLGLLLPQKSGTDGASGISTQKTRLLAPEKSDSSREVENRLICPELKGATPAQFAAAIDEARKLDDQAFERQLYLIGIRWVAEDADSLADYILANSEDDDNIAYTLIEILILQDRKAYLRICDRLRAEGHPLAEEFAEMEEEFQPEPPTDYLQALNQIASGEKPPNEHSIQQSLLKLAATNPTEAAKWLEKNPGEQADYSQRCQSLATGWASSDAAAALTWARGLDDQDARVMAFDACIQQLASSDVDEALKAFGEAKENGWMERKNYPGMRALAQALAERDPAEGLLFQSANNLNMNVDLSRYLPRDAEEYHALIRETEATIGYQNGFRIDYNDDPGTSLTNIATLGDDPITRNMLDSALRQWMGQDLQATKEAISNLPNSLRSAAASQVLESSQAFGSVSEALAFAKDNGCELGVNFARWAALRDDGVEAFSSLLEQKGSPQIAQLFVSNWASRDSDEAINWFQNGASEEEQELVAEQVLGHWAQKDPETASQWVFDQPDGTAKNHAVLGLATAVSREQPQAALVWLATLDDSKERNRSAFTAYTNLKSQSPVEAAASLTDPQLPASLRNFIQNQLRLYDL